MSDDKSKRNRTVKEPVKQPTGRPLKFETVAELDQAIRAYFDLCDPHIEERMVAAGLNQQGRTIWQKHEVMTDQKPYTMTGLARALGLTRQSLLNYKARDDFFDSIVQAKLRCEEYWEGRLDSPYSNGAKFNLTNNYTDTYHPWSDKQVLAGDPDAPLTTTLVRFVGSDNPDDNATASHDPNTD